MREYLNYNSPQALKSFLKENGLAAQKKFGQNFLVNGNAAKKMIDFLDIKPRMSVWEIGAGLGAVTKEILLREADLTVFEIDYGFSEVLFKFFEDYVKSDRLKIIKGDVLKTWKAYFNGHKIPDRVFGNLPYNIAATFIADTISEKVIFEKAVFTVQKEVAQRMRAKAKSAEYSSFSVLCQIAYDVKSVMNLSGSNFWPVPNVESRTVLMTKKADFQRFSGKDFDFFLVVLRAIFSQRRKTIKNNLISDPALIRLLKSKGDFQISRIAESALEKTNIAAEQRAENLEAEQILSLSRAVESVIMAQV